MITEYIDAAMRKARYEHIADEHIYFGKIPDFKGLWASGKTKATCEAELRERLDESIVLRRTKGDILDYCRKVECPRVVVRRRGTARAPVETRRR